MRRLPTIPPRDSRARLPVGLTLVLAALAAGQLALPHAVSLPPGGTVAMLATGHAPPPPARIGVPAILAVRPLFAPVVQAAANAPIDPLGGAVIAGSVSRGGATFALVQMPGGVIRTVAPGAVIAGWRLVALTPAGAQLVRAGNSLFVAYGAHAVAPGALSGNGQ